jgi:molybdenum cofactor guanylyltransferase
LLPTKHISARTAEKTFMNKPLVNNQQVNFQDQEIFGLILAGGQSSRMGMDKSRIEFHGKPQREYLFELLSKFCNKVFTSCKKTEQIPSNLNPIADHYELESPLNGILTAFHHTPNVAWLTVPVDMPLIDADTISHLISNRDSHKVATCFYDSDGKNPEPLLAIWESCAAPLLLKFYNENNFSPRKFLQQSNTKLVTVLNASALTNINTINDLKLFKETHRRNHRII